MNLWVLVSAVIIGGANVVAVAAACGGDSASAGAPSNLGSLSGLAPDLRAKLEAEMRAKLTPEIEAALRPKIAAEIRREFEDRMHQDRTLASAHGGPSEPTGSGHVAGPPKTGPGTGGPTGLAGLGDATQPGGQGEPAANQGKPGDTTLQDIWGRPGTHVWPMAGSFRLVELAVGTGLEEKSPRDVQEVYEKVPELLYCYSSFENSTPEQTITHVWRRGNRLVSRVELEVGESPKWKTWSKQRTQPNWTGLWSCEVLGPDGSQLGLTVFRIGG